MKDSHKKIGSVVLAGVMVAGGALQSGMVVANADDNVQSDSNIVANIPSMDNVVKAILKNRTKLFDYVWKSDLEKPENYMQKLLYNILTQDTTYKNKIEVLACGNENVVDRVISIVDRLVKNEGLTLNGDELWYESLYEFKTGKDIKYKSNANPIQERVVNNKLTGEVDAGLPSVNKLTKGNFYKVRIGTHNSFVFIYVKN